MSTRRFIAGALVVLIATANACRLTPLAVGGDGPTTVEPDDAAVGPDGEALTLLDRLDQRCAQDPGPLDSYATAADLTARLVGRWYGCDAAAMSPLQDGDGRGMIFNADGSWAVLNLNATGDGFDLATDPYDRGFTRYHALGNADAAEGVGGTDVARDDKAPRNGLVVFLGRVDSTGQLAGPDPSTFTFSKGPRQMTAAEVGQQPLSGHYVPID